MQPEEILCDRYQLKQLLGKAPGRQTWLADDVSMQPGEVVVVKLLAFSELMQWDDLKLFEREAQVLEHLQHPHIPRYRDSFTVGETPCWFALVQDYIPGSSLKKLLEEGKHFSEKQVRQMANNILHLLSYLHELSPPVLHRDIKPSNLIWGEDDFIYLVDFGAVQDRAAKEGATFTVVGTYGYAPLEQFGGRAVPASDLYGLGATLIHLLTGVSPADLPQEDLRIQFRDRISLDSPFIDWIEKLVEPDVAKRFQSAEEAVEALRSPSCPTSPQHPALTVAQPRSLHPPYGTRVDVQYSPDELLIQIPGSGRWQLLTLIPIAITLGFLGQAFLPVLTYLYFEPMLLLFMLVALVFITLAVYWEFLPTFVYFEGNEFWIYKRMFKAQLSLDHGSVRDIEDVFHTLKTFSSGKSRYEKRVVVIQTCYGEKVFGAGLSWEECIWLVNVTENWLNR